MGMEQGFTEQDIRFFLTNKFFLRVETSMREKLDDPEWGKIPEYSVTFTAPGCPPGTPEDPNEPPTQMVTLKKKFYNRWYLHKRSWIWI